jgi:hypothetical protein
MMQTGTHLGLPLKHFAAMMRRRSKPAGRERELIGLAGAPPVAARSSFAAPAAKAAMIVLRWFLQ